MTAPLRAALAEVLGASLSLSRVTGLGTREMGLFTEEMTLPTGSGWVGRQMGDTKARTLTSSSIVAIARGTQVIASPTPTDVKQDVLVVTDFDPREDVLILPLQTTVDEALTTSAPVPIVISAMSRMVSRRYRVRALGMYRKDSP